MIKINKEVKLDYHCNMCDNPYPYKCEECLASIVENETPEEKINVASGEDCYAFT